MTHTIEAEGLTKRFGATRALDGVDLAAAELIVAAALEDDAEIELDTAELLDVETLVDDDNPAAEGEAAPGGAPAK